jgi:hypothetical protein
LTSLAIAVAIAAFFLSDGVASIIYDYSFTVSPGTSFGKVTTLLGWLLCSFLLAHISVRLKWRPSGFRSSFIIFLILAAALLSINILVFHSIFDKAGCDELGPLEGRPVIVAFDPEATVSFSSSTLEHTHSLKPVLHWFFGLFADAKGMGYDVGSGLYQLYPTWLVCPMVIALLAVYLVASATILAHSANEGKNSHQAWLSTIVFSLASFSLFEATLDGGPFSTSAQVGIALLALHLLMRRSGQGRGMRWVPILIFAPLLVLAALNLFLHSLAPRAISLHEHFLVSSLSLAAAGLYEFKRVGAKSIALPLILLLLAFNLSSFRPYSELRESREGDDVYMILSIDPSVADGELLQGLAGIPELAQPTIIARDGRTAVVKASTTRAGISSRELARRIIGKRLAPLESNVRFRFGDPSARSSYSAYLHVDEARLRQALPGGVIQVNSIAEFGESLVKIEYTAPQGLYSGHYLLLALSQRGLRLTHYAYIRPLVGRDATTQFRDFLRISVPVTRLQPIVAMMFP